MTDKIGFDSPGELPCQSKGQHESVCDISGEECRKKQVSPLIA
jgi:hypothetical protein